MPQMTRMIRLSVRIIGRAIKEIEKEKGRDDGDVLLMA